jgi:hypothetical protein
VYGVSNGATAAGVPYSTGRNDGPHAAIDSRRF